MIYESLIAPHENPASLRDIKRALLTYDKVKIIDPDDRDVMPSNSFMSSIMGMPLIGMDIGPIRPMGKAIGYDDIFQKIVDNCKPAIQQGLLEVISTYQKADTKSFTIGGVPNGGYPLNTQFVFWLYRRMSQDQEFLQSAIALNQSDLLSNIDVAESLSLEGRGDGGINDIPALPLIENVSLGEDQAKYITQIARARIAALIKYSGYCEMKDLVPVFPSDVYGGVVSNLLNNAQIVLSEVEEDPYWFKRNRVLELCHEEYLSDESLDTLSIDEVIKLRSSVWGKQAEARETLFESIGAISQEIENDDNFEKEAKSLVEGYRKVTDDLENERTNLHFKIKCDIGIGVLGGGTGLAGLLTQLQSPLASMGLTLAAGGMWALEKSKDYIPVLKELKSKEESLKRGAGFGLQNFYSRIKKG
jgi:hypothetical protein